MRIRKHDFVLIDDEMKCRLHKIVDMKIKIKKNYINLLFLINKKYGSTFTFINNKWIRSKKNTSKLDIDNNIDIEGTNKDIYYNNNSQKLTEENIHELKENNYENPYEVIQKLVDNSSTFKEKTIISKFKYIEKKLKRHFCQFTIYECNISNLLHFYYKYFPEKISNVRIDYLANILFHLNKDPNEKDKKQNIINDSLSMTLEETNTTNNENNNIYNNNNNNNNNNIPSCSCYYNHNVLIYDDTFGLMTSVINITYDYNVNIFSLVYKNSCSSIIPSFGIKKNTNILKINILNSNSKGSINKERIKSTDTDMDKFMSTNNNNNNNNNNKNNHHNNNHNIALVDDNYNIIYKMNNNSFNNENNSLNKDITISQNNNQIIEHKILSNVCEEKINSEKTHSYNINSDNLNEQCNNQNELTSHNVSEFSCHEKRKLNDISNINDISNEPNKKIKNYQDNHNMNKENVINYEEIKKEIMIQDLYQRKAESFVIIISSEFIYNTNTNLYLLINTLINVSLKYLNNDSKLIFYSDDFNILNMFLKILINTNSFIHIKLNEYILREQQIIKRRTHPVIKNAKLSDGFLLTALKVQN
ncbi:tRNA (adenine(58)-N(1))-methyltransferase non-catalytic subunit TRM6, putative [Plasmodium sp. gorilla clade G2]|uniref:tRNA (adenine(58)-N(1))-methyltransferase non-catalytic subunit TRM6, putative n=1 Tax=Plasmodium sp. gorilla clade G2 TaxID=880535 RepID=UPI000D21FFDF|nr:tRNA (adenine(58)-N(1))-methyltransferase non-catalytic subunit TRM6, putative [Plasmodium sp. gorilla clade G2]SOV14138.1 tRNA (adenine(58)-N(1))-methyltransferase non-catalytic subunit TRM6, putative [Plasmodium sp. gorilla clade G2]